MGKTSEAKIKYFDGEDYTCVTFQPDLAKFKMEKLDKDIVALLTRRAYDVAGSCKGVKVMLNGKKLPVSHLSFPYEKKLMCFLDNNVMRFFKSYRHRNIFRQPSPS